MSPLETGIALLLAVVIIVRLAGTMQLLPAILLLVGELALSYCARVWRNRTGARSDFHPIFAAAVVRGQRANFVA